MLVVLKEQEVRLLAGAHKGQGDAAEVLATLLGLAAEPLEPLFQLHQSEVLMEDSPVGFIFIDRWVPDLYVRLNVGDHSFAGLQECLNVGVAEAVTLALEPSDPRHAQFLEATAYVGPEVPAVKFRNVIQPGDVLCFHLIRYNSGGRPSQDMVQHEQSALPYPEELQVLGVAFQLQSLVVHEHWHGFGNSGHYFTIARTNDEAEPWIELSDEHVAAVSRAHALSKTRSATLLFYARKAVQSSTPPPLIRDCAGLPFIQRTHRGTGLARQTVAHSLGHAKAFGPRPHERAEYLLHSQHGYSAPVIRQALRLHQVFPKTPIEEILQSVQKEATWTLEERHTDSTSAAPITTPPADL